MKKIAVALVFLGLLSNFAFANFGIPKIEDLVKENNLIVFGTLKNGEEVETKTEQITNGILIVEKIILGNYKLKDGQTLQPGDKLKIQWINSKQIPCQFRYPENGTEIWFLNVDNTGNIEPIRHPGVTAGVGALPEIYKQIEQKVKNYQTDNVKSLDIVVESKYSIQEKPKSYSPLYAFLVALFSISLYFILYRSRFKIR